MRRMMSEPDRKDPTMTTAATVHAVCYAAPGRCCCGCATCVVHGDAVVREEREACALLCEEAWEGPKVTPGTKLALAIVARRIRERGLVEEADGELQAWSNGYEVVAARSEEEAREVLRAANLSYEVEDLDGDGWKVLAVDKVVSSDDGSQGVTIREMLAESPEPRHLYSCEV